MNSKRKKERKDFPEFYQKHISYIKENKLVCEECGSRLQGDVSEVAHILPKGKFKSISTEDGNILYLCGWMSNNNCHSKYDESSNEVFRAMSVFDKSSKKYEELKEILEEKINYKTEDRYGKS